MQSFIDFSFSKNKCALLLDSYCGDMNYETLYCGKVDRNVWENTACNFKVEPTQDH
jgi:hypothetical protein